MSRLFGPGGEAIGSQAEQEFAMQLRAELALGRLALKCLSVMLAEKEGRKTAIRKSAIEKVRTKWPGAVIRFGEEAERITLRLMTPAELDEADRLAAAANKERTDALEQMAATPAAEGGNGE